MFSKEAIIKKTKKLFVEETTEPVSVLKGCAAYNKKYHNLFFSFSTPWADWMKEPISPILSNIENGRTDYTTLQHIGGDMSEKAKEVQKVGG